MSPTSSFRRSLEAAFSKLQAGASLEVEVTLTPDEAAAIVRWIKHERYRHPRRAK